MIEARFELEHTSARAWAVKDHRYADDDPRHLVVRIFELDEAEVDAMWVRDLPLALRYPTPADVLEDVVHFYRHDAHGLTHRHPLPVGI